MTSQESFRAPAENNSNDHGNATGAASRAVGGSPHQRTIEKENGSDLAKEGGALLNSRNQTAIRHDLSVHTRATILRLERILCHTVFKDSGDIKFIWVATL